MINPPRTIVSAFFQSEKKKKKEKKEKEIKETGSIPDRRAVRRKQSKASLNFTLRTLVVEWNYIRNAGLARTKSRN